MPPLIQARLTGHLTVDALRPPLEYIAREVGQCEESPAVVLDCSAMTGYDVEARDAFVEWSGCYRDRIRGLAIVVKKPLWYGVVATMSLINRQEMRAFGARESAEAWARRL